MSTDAGIEDGVREDAELIAAVRGGDVVATGELYERHAGAALVVARRYTDSTADAEDVVADAFAAVFLALQRGNGPDVAFRAYLFTVVRRMAGLQRDRARRAEPTDDVASLEAGTAWAGTAEEPALEGFERGVVARAFHALPERWQAVLWHTEVEGLQPAQIAPILGLTANGVAALAYRAREGLRQAYLQQHLNDPLDDGCRAVAGKLGSYVRGGLGTRESAQVEQHLDGCGECRALVLELTDVNHGMRAVIAPLVLGLAGMGALAHLLPVGGGIAAGAALAGHGEGAAVGTATAGAGGVAAAVAGGGATTAASAGGVAAFLASIPATAVAVAAGAVVLAGVATAIVVGLVRAPDPAAAPLPTTSASSTLDQPSPAPSVLAPAPGQGVTPTAAPSAPGVPATEPGPTSVPTSMPSSSPTSAPTAAPTTAPTPVPTSEPTAEPTPQASPEPTPEPTANPTPTPPPPPPPDPAALSVVVPDGGLALEAGAGGQELRIDVANTGGAAADSLTADVTLPPLVTLDDVVTMTSTGVMGRFAAATDPGWVCTRATGAAAGASAHCTLAALAPSSTASLVLRVSVDEEYEQADGEIGLDITGADLDFHAPPIKVNVTPAPARLAVVGPTPGSLALVTGRGAELSMVLRNAGGVPVPAAGAAVELALPGGVELGPWEDGAWACEEVPRLQVALSGTVRCSLTAPLAARAAVALDLPLWVAAEPDEVRGRTITMTLGPAGRGTPATVSVPFTVAVPARLDVSAPAQVEVLGGHVVPFAVGVENVGDLAAGRVGVSATAPVGVAWSDVDPVGWACSFDGRKAACVRDDLAANASASLALGLRGEVGSVGKLGDVTVTVEGPEADPVEDTVVPVVGRAPVVSVSDASAHLLDGGEVQVELAVAVGDGADAAGVVARATLPPNVAYEPSDASSAGCALVGGAVECALGDVPAGGSATVLFHTRLRWTDPAARVEIVARSGDVRSAPVKVAVPATSGGLSARFIGSGMGVTEIGAPLLSCTPSTSTACRNIQEYGSSDNNGLPMDPLDEAPPPKGDGARPDVKVSSSASLGALKGKVAFAGLYWAANKVDGDAWSGDRTTVKLRGPDGAYEQVTGTDLTTATDNANRQYYQSFADVTTLVAAQGGGLWSLADAAVANGRGDHDPTYFAGWALVVVYADGSRADVSVYDGGAWVGTEAQPPVFSFAGATGTTARVGVVAWEGDYRATGDRLTLSTPLCEGPSTALTPVRQGGALGSSANAFDSSATGWRAANSLGTDAKGFAPVQLTCDVSSLTATTTGDQYLVGAITLRSEPPPAP